MINNARKRDDAVDKLAAEYLPTDAPEGFIEDLLNDDDTLLMYGILKELRALRQVRTGGRPIEQVLQQQEQPESEKEATYYAESMGVQSEWSYVEFGFAASAVLVWGWDEDIYIAFKEGGKNRTIPLKASKSSFSIGGDVPLDASRLYFKQAPNANETGLKVIAQ